MPNPTPSPALAVDAIEQTIAASKASAGCHDALCCIKSSCQYPEDCPLTGNAGRKARAQLTALQQAVADAQKDTERLNLLEREAEIRDECFDLGGFYAALFYRNVPITRTMIDEQIAFLAAITAARTPDPEVSDA